MHAIPLEEAQEEPPFFVPDWEDTRPGEAGQDLLESLTAVKERLAWLLAPPESLLDELNNATISPTLQELAHVLGRRGYRVKIHTCPGGGLHSLPHTFLTARAPGMPPFMVDQASSGWRSVRGGGPRLWEGAARPTPRYSLLHSLLPRLLVASPYRTFEAIALMAGEMEIAFKQQGMPLPPWRKLDSLAFRYHPAFSAAYSAAYLVARSAAYAGVTAPSATAAEDSMAAFPGAGATQQDQASAALPAAAQAASATAGVAVETLALAMHSTADQHALPHNSHHIHYCSLGAAPCPSVAGRSARQARQRAAQKLVDWRLLHSELMGASSAPPALAAE